MMRKFYATLFLLSSLISLKSIAQEAADFYAIIDGVSEERIKADITTLAGLVLDIPLVILYHKERNRCSKTLGFLMNFKRLLKPVKVAWKCLIKKTIKNQMGGVLLSQYGSIMLSRFKKAQNTQIALSL